jgi:hypothetical protein
MTTFTITTLSIMTLNIMTLGIITFSITINKSRHCAIMLNVTYKPFMLSVVLPSVVVPLLSICDIHVKHQILFINEMMQYRIS